MKSSLFKKIIREINNDDSDAENLVDLDDVEKYIYRLSVLEIFLMSHYRLYLNLLAFLGD